MDRAVVLMVLLCMTCMRLCDSMLAGEAAATDAPVTTTTELPPYNCSSVVRCGDCVQHKECFWCYASDNSTEKKHAGADGFCDNYPAGQIWPTTRTCSLSQSRYGVCWFDMLSMIIAAVVIVTVMCVSAVITVYCCCCCSCNGGRSRRQEERYQRELETRRQAFDERRVERETRRDDIRRKYALKKDGVNAEETGRYNRFGNETNDRNPFS